MTEVRLVAEAADAGAGAGAEGDAALNGGADEAGQDRGDLGEGVFQESLRAVTEQHERLGRLENAFGTAATVHPAATLRALLFPAELVGPWLVGDAVTGAPPPAGRGRGCWSMPAGPGWGTAP